MDSKEINSQYVGALTKLMQAGYYDPEDSYANNNVEFLISLNNEEIVCNGSFLFRLKLSGNIATIRSSNYAEQFIMHTTLQSMVANSAFEHALIDNFMQKIYSPAIYLYSDKENSMIIFEHKIILPFHDEQIIKTIRWFDEVVMTFKNDYLRLVNEFKEKKNVN